MHRTMYVQLYTLAAPQSSNRARLFRVAHVHMLHETGIVKENIVYWLKKYSL